MADLHTNRRNGSFRRFLCGTMMAMVAFSLAGCTWSRTTPPAEVMNFGLHIESPAGGAGVAEVGDTVYSIAQRYHLAAQDIIAANNLHSPYRVVPGQRIILPPPHNYRVGDLDTLYSISRMYDVSVERLAQENHLRAPYPIKVGDILRIPSGVGAGSNMAQAESIQDDTPSPAPHHYAAIQAEPLPAPHQAKMASISAKKISPQKHKSNNALLGGTVALSGQPDFIWPVHGRVISSYGPKTGHLFNDGVNIAAPRGAPVVAAAAGTVVYAGNGLASYGNLILIRHGGGLVTAYAHLDSISISKGTVVRKGQVIGSVGSTGTVAKSQLHFEIRRGTRTMDPEKYLAHA